MTLKIYFGDLKFFLDRTEILVVGFNLTKGDTMRTLFTSRLTRMTGRELWLSYLSERRLPEVGKG